MSNMKSDRLQETQEPVLNVETECLSFKPSVDESTPIFEIKVDLI